MVGVAVELSSCVRLLKSESLLAGMYVEMGEVALIVGAKITGGVVVTACVGLGSAPALLSVLGWTLRMCSVGPDVIFKGAMVGDTVVTLSAATHVSEHASSRNPCQESMALFLDGPGQPSVLRTSTFHKKHLSELPSSHLVCFFKILPFFLRQSKDRRPQVQGL